MIEIKNIDDYIKDFPIETQDKLKKIRDIIKEEAPEAIEKISYKMPTFYQNGNLVHFAGYKNHIGFYPTPEAIEHFKEELSCYKGGKGSVQFPLIDDIPYDLIRKIIKYRVNSKKCP